MAGEECILAYLKRKISVIQPARSRLAARARICEVSKGSVAVRLDKLADRHYSSGSPPLYWPVYKAEMAEISAENKGRSMHRDLSLE